MLGQDHDEEVRQSERLIQKDKNAIDGGTRLDTESVLKISA